MSAWSSTVEDAIHTWIVAGSGLGADKVIWSQQNGARPEPPLITMRCAVLSTPGRDWIDVEDATDPQPEEEIRHVVRGPRMASLELQCFGDPTDASGLAAQSILNNVIASAFLPSIRQGLSDALIGIGTAEPIQFLGQVTDTSVFEPRAVTRINMHLANEISELGTYIEIVETVNMIQ